MTLSRRILGAVRYFRAMGRPSPRNTSRTSIRDKAEQLAMELGRPVPKALRSTRKLKLLSERGAVR